MNEQVKKSKMNKQTNDKKAAVNQNELINKNANFEPDGLMT